MYRKVARSLGTLRGIETTEGQSIELKMERILENKEPIEDGTPLIYTMRSDGVLPSYNIRTDRWEIAVEASGNIEKSYKAKRENNNKKPEESKENSGEITGGESI